ncbi:hypothetical protein JZ751_008210 [Albula glossodonta]|uniref:Toll-like receptor 4 n=1 Tax=Albula glossodonta TaxID=121402 RepID=A0A8T2MM42_9TELE|nr:hypothetical protein JZ751_008210 [Albula glossodonta]
MPTMQFSNIKSLETLIVKDNAKPTEFRSAFVDLPLLKHLDLSNNKLSVKNCCGNMFNGTPQLRHLNLSYNIELKFSPIPFLGLECLEVLDLQHTHLNAIGQFALLVNLKSLKYLDVSYSGLIFKSHISMQGLSSLKVFILSGNTFEGDSIHYMFSNLTNLERLDISDCGIEDLRWSSFTQLDRLRHLALSGNRLMAVDFLTNPSLVSLTQIDAGQNNIVSIPQNILSHLPGNLSAFDLSRNPIECSCSNTDLIMWAINQGEKLIHPESTLCKTPFSTYVKLIEFDIAYCRHIWEVKVVVAFGIVCLILIILAVVYKYQFYLRYGFILLRGYRNPRRQEFQYDAFVIYSSKDEAWVMEELVEKIEGGVPPIHLCLHVRDFQAGKSITSNIIDEGITGSRKVIVLVSQHFIDSDWCRFEFEVAQSWVVLERNASLIIIILEDVEEEKTKKVMGLHKHLKRNTYLKWKGNALSDVMFWNRLRSAIISGKHLNLSYNIELKFSPIPFLGLECLEVLDLQHTHLNAIGQFALLVNLKSLKYLDVSYSGLIFKSHISMQGLSSLKVFILSGNTFEGDSIHYMFSNLTNLERLDISDCGIEDLRWSSFTQLDRLRHLALSGNRLMAVDFLTNPSLVSLTQIDAGQNNIVSIPQNILSHLPGNLSAFDLSRNPIECSCSNTDLIMNPRCQEFQYDAFVIYSSKDEAWVMEELVEKIEGGVPPIYLCLHVRDFQAGKSITSNIIDEGITGSRKVIVVVSQHFIDSDWCRFEFEVAQSWVVLERNASLIIIILEDVEEEKTKKVMGLHKHLKRNTYLKWKGNALSDVMFWNRLRSAIISGK